MLTTDVTRKIGPHPVSILAKHITFLGRHVYADRLQSLLCNEVCRPISMGVAYVSIGIRAHEI